MKMLVVVRNRSVEPKESDGEEGEESVPEGEFVQELLKTHGTLNLGYPQKIGVDAYAAPILSPHPEFVKSLKKWCKRVTETKFEVLSDEEYKQEKSGFNPGVFIHAYVDDPEASVKFEGRKVAGEVMGGLILISIIVCLTILVL